MAEEIPRIDELDDAKRIARAQRIVEMLARWDSENCPDEPDWDVNDFASVRFGAEPQAAPGPEEVPGGCGST